MDERKTKTTILSWDWMKVNKCRIRKALVTHFYNGLVPTGTATCRTLSRKLGLSEGQTSRLIDQLEEAGHLIRRKAGKSKFIEIVQERNTRLVVEFETWSPPIPEEWEFHPSAPTTVTKPHIPVNWEYTPPQVR